MSAIVHQWSVYQRIAAVFLLLFLLNCGKRGPLTLPSQVLPKPVETLNLFQIGDTIRLQVQFPPFLSDNRTEFESARINRIFVHYSDQLIPQKKFRKKSVLLLKLRPEDLTKTESTYSVHIPFKVKNLENLSHYFAVRYEYDKKKAELSRISSIKTRLPAKPPGDLKISREKKVLRLTWTRPQFNLLDQPVQNNNGYNIYRKIYPHSPDEENADTAEFVKVNQESVLAEYYEDTDTSREGKYIYYVSVVHAADIESAASNQVTVEVKDIYPPDIPSNLMVFKARDHMFLTWEKVGDKDLSYYRIYRKATDQEEYKLIADRVTDNFFKDEQVRRGTLYFYTVSAVDIKDNESDPSTEAREEF